MGSSTLNTDFYIALGLYGRSGAFELKSNNEVRKVGAGGGIIDVHVELIKSVIGWSEDLEYRAYTDDNGDGTNWVALTGNIGTPVEIDDNNKIIRGDLLQLNVQPYSEGDRDVSLIVDLYHKLTNTKIATTRQNIKQSDSVQRIPLADGTPVPELTSSNIHVVSTPIYENKWNRIDVVPGPNTSNEKFPHIREYDLGSDTGIVDVLFDPVDLPDRMVVIYNNEVVIDTGYATYGLGTSPAKFAEYQRDLNNNLAGRGLEPSTLRTIQQITGTNRNISYSGLPSAVRGTFIGHTFNKNLPNVNKAYVLVYTPLKNTHWGVQMGQVGKRLYYIHIPGGIRRG